MIRWQCSMTQVKCTTFGMKCTLYSLLTNGFSGTSIELGCDLIQWSHSLYVWHLCDSLVGCLFLALSVGINIPFFCCWCLSRIYKCTLSSYSCWRDKSRTVVMLEIPSFWAPTIILWSMLSLICSLCHSHTTTLSRILHIIQMSLFLQVREWDYPMYCCF